MELQKDDKKYANKGEDKDNDEAQMKPNLTSDP